MTIINNNNNQAIWNEEWEKKEAFCASIIVAQIIRDILDLKTNLVSVACLHVAYMISDDIFMSVE